jgi:predicted transcriptional regulator
MSRGQFRVLLIVCAAASLLGGAFSGSLMRVRAQDYPWAKRTASESFVVVDERGAKRAELGVTSQGDAALVLYDERGRVIWNTPNVPGTRIWPTGPDKFR